MLLRQNNVCLNVGEEAPDFALPDQNGNRVSSSDFKGKKKLIITFNPGKLDNACKDYFNYYQVRSSDFAEHNAQILAVNMDTVKANRDWAEEAGLSFPILSDYTPLGEMTLKYDCLVPNEGYGRRAIFVVDSKGEIGHIEVLKGSDDVCPDIDGLLDVVKGIA
jgi:peroxiredoxin